MLYSICYVSSITDILEDLIIKDLFSDFVYKNIQNNISGILLYNAGNFLQYLEGNEQEIKALYYNKICNDYRHKNPIVILEKKIDKLYFSGFEAGYTSIIEQNQVKNLKSYLKLLKYLDSTEMEVLSKTVNSFLSAG